MKLSISYDLTGGFEAITGGVTLPREFTARLEYEEDHTLVMAVAVANGVPSVNAITVERNPTRPPLSGWELSRLKVRDWLDFICREAAWTSEGDGRHDPVTDDTFDVASDAVKKSTRRRRRAITDDFLRDVAQMYQECGGSLPDLSERIPASISSAYRYVAAAKEKGFIG